MNTPTQNGRVRSLLDWIIIASAGSVPLILGVTFATLRYHDRELRTLIEQMTTLRNAYAEGPNPAFRAGLAAQWATRDADAKHALVELDELKHRVEALEQRAR